MYVFLNDEHNKNIRILAHVSAIFCEISRRRALLTQEMSLCKKEQLVADLGWMGVDMKWKEKLRGPPFRAGLDTL